MSAPPGIHLEINRLVSKDYGLRSRNVICELFINLRCFKMSLHYIVVGSNVKQTLFTVKTTPVSMPISRVQPATPNGPIPTIEQGRAVTVACVRFSQKTITIRKCNPGTTVTGRLVIPPPVGLGYFVM